MSPQQDSTFLYTDPPSVVGLWLALGDATLENGCLWVKPGSHVHGVKKRFTRLNADGTQVGFSADEKKKMEDDEDEVDTGDGIEGYVPLEVKKGTLVCLHGSVMHYSRENTSSKPRHAYTVHFVESERPDGQYRWSEKNWLLRPADDPFVPL